MKTNLDLTYPRRLSIYIREERPELLTEVSEKIIDKLLIRLDLTQQRNYSEVKIVWVFFTMYSIISRDLHLFRRIYKDAKFAESMFQNALALLNDKLVNAELYKQYNQYYDKNRALLTEQNVIVSQTLVEYWLLNEHYYVSVDSISKDYVAEL